MTQSDFQLEDNSNLFYSPKLKNRNQYTRLKLSGNTKQVSWSFASLHNLKTDKEAEFPLNLDSKR